MTDPELNKVDAALDEVARQRPHVPDDLMTAVLRDAARLQPKPQQFGAKDTLWDRILETIGGWPALSGLAAAGVAGVWVGFAPPVALEAATAQLFGNAETVDLFGVNMLDGFAVDGVVQ